MRLFFAIEFSEALREAIDQAIRRIPVARPPWKWVARANFHITVKFLGDMPESRLRDLDVCAEAAARSVEAFQMRFGRLGGFPDLKRPRVLYYEIVDGMEPAASLAASLDEALADRLGIPRETRPFRAHATIARIKGPISPDITTVLSAVPALEAPAEHVRSLALFRSELGRQGSKYHRVKEFALTKSKC
jgi:2'-5' RNA ligase